MSKRSVDDIVYAILKDMGIPRGQGTWEDYEAAKKQLPNYLNSFEYNYAVKLLAEELGL